MITLTKDKIIHTNEYGPQSDKYVRKEVFSLCEYLEEAVELSDDFTLGDLFHYLEKYDGPFVDIIFGSALGHFPFESFIQDMKKPAEDEGDKLNYLQIQRFGERWEHSGEIDLSIGFSGIGMVNDISHGIGFTPLYVLKDLPLKLNTEFIINEMRCPLKLARFFIKFCNWIYKSSLGWTNQFNYTYVKGTTCFSVYELISAVLSEISFAGDPGMRDEKIAEIMEDVDEMKQELSNGG